MNLILKNGYLYSADVLMLWLKEFYKPKQFSIKKLLHHLDDEVWYRDVDESNIDGAKVSPNDVIKNPTKHKRRYNRIKKSNYKLPVVICDGILVDGYHRLANAFLDGRSRISAYLITEEVLQPFAVGRFNNSLDVLCLNMLMKIYYYSSGKVPNDPIEAAIGLLSDELIRLTRNQLIGIRSTIRHADNSHQLKK